MKLSKSLIYWIIGGVFIIFLWEIGYLIFPESIPEIIKIFKSILINLTHVHLTNIFWTILHSLIALCISIIISILIVLLVNSFPNFEFLITPIIVLLKTTPIVALVPVLMIFFSQNMGGIIGSAVTICFFPIVVAGIDGMKRVPENIIELSKVYFSSRWQQLKYFKKGYVLESILSSLKVSAPLSVVGAIVGEYIVSGENSGLGIFICSNLGAGDIESRYVGMVLATAVGLLFYFIAYFIHYKYEKTVFISK